MIFSNQIKLFLNFKTHIESFKINKIKININVCEMYMSRTLG